MIISSSLYLRRQSNEQALTTYVRPSQHRLPSLIAAIRGRMWQVAKEVTNGHHGSTGRTMLQFCSFREEQLWLFFFFAKSPKMLGTEMGQRHSLNGWIQSQKWRRYVWGGGALPHSIALGVLKSIENSVWLQGQCRPAQPVVHRLQVAKDGYECRPTQTRNLLISWDSERGMLGSWVWTL